MCPSPSASSSSDDTTGLDLTNRRLGDFQLLRRLGKGGMAEVYLAEQLSLKRQVAVKVVRPEFVQDETYIKRFQQEATAAGGLNHANIVQVYVIGEEDGTRYIAQEYVQGPNLKDFIKKKGSLEVPIALHIMRQVASALQAAAVSGIVHRDIKPENILLTRKGEAKIADFGLAQLTLQGEKVNLTQTGVTMGTPLYMSPEQVNGKTLDARSDIYSFGVMCFHMLSGRPPFTGETALAVAVKHLNEEPEPLDKLRADLPKPLVELIHRMMAKRREDRPADAQAILTEIRQISKLMSGKLNEAEFKAQSVRTTVIRHLPLINKRQIMLGTLACLLAFSGSAAVGWMIRTGDPLLAPAPVKPPFPKKATAQAQYYHALSQGDKEEAWQAVIDYFPSDPVEKQHAREHLALIYLKSRRFEPATSLYREFSVASDPYQRATGFAGLAVISHLKGNASEAADYLREFTTLKKEINSELARMLEDLRSRTKKPATGG